MPEIPLADWSKWSSEQIDDVPYANEPHPQKRQ